ncbi:hypothetical protein SJI19_19935 [Acerihabitans sp. TG2]|uniref:hypothetical protein n=1 Tax=Acerihabitans sp. TG2 TaxID=3096008 RepID=UPI002B234267|nr:hypothetical protein [Acerihabitans sp. TG2]MEA9392777.1 hypothetical protein [Acerihabitans sp. TG2]
MDIDNFLGKICQYIWEHNEHYAKRFNFATCERWICTEICHIANFDLGFTPMEGHDDQRYSLYDEDKKRDLSLYQGYGDEASLIKHIEVKVVYPFGCNESKWFRPLINGMNSRLVEHSEVEGWVFMVWTSGVKKRDKYRSPDEFFNSIEKYLKTARSQALLGHVFMPDMDFLPVAETNFIWCGAPKRIVVKALRIHLIKQLSDAELALVE